MTDMATDDAPDTLRSHSKRRASMSELGPEADSIPHQTPLPPNKINVSHKIYPTPSNHPYDARIPRTGGSSASRAKRARGTRLSVVR